jgi:A118 family predicted phage portal protein
MSTFLPQLGLWSAWYSGDPDHLSSVYGGATGADSSRTGFFASDHGGFKATATRLARWFWGERSIGPDRRTKLHIPIAAELCQASADLLFSDQVTLTVENAKTAGKATQERLDALSGDGMHAEFAEAAEVGAALGGVYMRVTWDPDLMDEPFFTHVDADQAIPEFKWGRLSAVTFWQVIKRDGKIVYRHLERHEKDTFTGHGVILHGLYMGEEDNLGVQVPLNSLTATGPLMAAGEAAGNTIIVDSKSKGLCVVYVPNQTPNRIWRTDLLGRHFGRSDLDGVEQLMDALDETMSSWMRDVRLGKAKIMVAKSLLQNAGPGNGQVYDNDQEVYAPVNTLAGKDQPLSSQIESVQFDIRVQEHKETAEALLEQILQMSGYSTQTFGVGDTGTVRTATEIESRERRSLMTRDRKLRLWRPALAELTEKLLAVDAALFGNPNTAGPVTVTFPDGVQETQLALANTAQALFLAQSASTAVRVGLLHPDWDDDAVAEEVTLITAEFAIALDPMVPPDFGAPIDTPADTTA